MKKEQLLKYFVSYRDFVIRFVVLIARICILAIGAVESLSIFDHIFNCIECWGFPWEYVDNFLLGLALVFPFKIVKKPLHLWSYFIILIVTTLSYLSKYSDYRIVWEQHILLLFAINILAVFQYIRHFIDPKKFNPFFPVKKLAPVLLAMILLVGYFLFDIHKTEDGTRYFKMDGLYLSFPMIEIGDGGWYPNHHRGWPIYTKETFKDLYLISGGVKNDVISDIDSLYIGITITPEKRSDVELYENDQKIMHIEFGASGVGKITGYEANNSLDMTVSANKRQLWVRDKKGKFHSKESNYTYEYGLSEDYDLSIRFDYARRFHDGGWIGDLSKSKYSPDNGLKITIHKSITYPERVWRLLPFARKKLPWNLAIKQGDKMTKLVEGIELWYK